MRPEEQLAQALAADAVGWFVAALVVVLLLVASAWALRPRASALYQRVALPPPALLAMRLLLGFGFIVALGLFFAEMSEAVHAGDDLARFDTALAQGLAQQLSRPTLQVFSLLTWFGNTETLTGLCLVIAAGLWWRQRRRLAVAWVLAIGGNGVLNTSLKNIFQRARPVHEHGVATAEGFSFPSGHSSGSLVAYGMLAYVLLRLLPARWHLPVLLGAVAIAFTTGCSRVFLQVHYASDVMAGFASGLSWLAVCVLSSEYWDARRAVASQDVTAAR